MRSTDVPDSSAALAALVFAVTVATPASSSATPPCKKPPAIEPEDFGGRIDNPYYLLKPGALFGRGRGGLALLWILTRGHDDGDHTCGKSGPQDDSRGLRAGGSRPGMGEAH